MLARVVVTFCDRSTAKGRKRSMVEDAFWGCETMKGIANWFIRCGLLLLLMVGVSACGENAPKSVVETALQYEMARAGDIPNTLVGHELLNSWTTIRAVKVQSQKHIRIAADGETYSGVDVRGTYRLAVRPPNRKSRYQRTNPFVMTLARRVDPESELDRWLLAHPSPPTSSEEGFTWRLVDFLPQPDPQLDPQPPSPNSSQQADQPKNDDMDGLNQISSIQSVQGVLSVTGATAPEQL
ncbi:MAG: hypothetical protein AB4040_00845 [Synechococcus sp.]